MTKGVYWIMTKVEDFIKDAKISEVIGMAKLNDILGREEKEKKPSKTMIIFAVIAFAVVGLIITITSGKAFLKGEFQGGIMDISEEKETGDN